MTTITEFAEKLAAEFERLGAEADADARDQKKTKTGRQVIKCMARRDAWRAAAALIREKANEGR